MSRLILYNLPHHVKKEVLRNIFGVNENIVEILLLLDDDKTSPGFAIINFKTKEECTAAMKYFYTFHVNHLPSSVKLQQYSEIDDDNESPNEAINNNTIHVQYKNIIQEYEQNRSLDDVIYLLVEDQNSVIRTGHKEFVKSMSLIVLYDCRPSCTTKVGNMFDELLFKNIISVTAIIHGICDALQEWKDNHPVIYPELYSQISALIYPIEMSETAISLKVNCLKNTFVTLYPEFSIIIFVEVLQSLLKSIKVQDLKLDVCGTKDIISWNNDEHIMKSNVVLHEIKHDKSVNDIQQKTKSNGIKCDKLRGISSGNSVSLCLYNNNGTLQESNNGLKKKKLEHEEIKNNEIHNKSIAKTDTICLFDPNVILQKIEDNGIKHDWVIGFSLENPASICLSNLHGTHTKIEIIYNELHSIIMNSSVGYDECNPVVNIQYESKQNQRRDHKNTYKMLEYLMTTTKTKGIFLKIQFMIQKTLDLRKNKWIPKCVESISKLIDKDSKTNYLTEKSISLCKPKNQD